MKRVTGIGGIFFKCKDASSSKAWYKNHLGIDSDQYGGCFKWYDEQGKAGHTVWSAFNQESNYFEPSQAAYMVNYRVADLDALINQLKAEGVTIIGNTDVQEYGKFAWVMDPDGNKIELWEPPQDFDQYTTIVQLSE